MNSSISKHLGARLRFLRAKRNLPVQYVADFVGVAPSTYREWEEGRAIRGEPYDKLREVFGVSWAELMTGVEIDPHGILQRLNEIEEHVKRIRDLLQEIL